MIFRNKILFVDGNGIVADRSGTEINSSLQQGYFVVARLKTVNDMIYAMPTYYDDENRVMWFSFTNGTNNLAQIVGIDENKEIVYYTGS